MLIWKSSAYGKIHWMHQPIQVTVLFVFVFSVLISNFRSNYDCRRMETMKEKDMKGVFNIWKKQIEKQNI